MLNYNEKHYFELGKSVIEKTWRKNNRIIRKIKEICYWNGEALCRLPVIEGKINGIGKYYKYDCEKGWVLDFTIPYINNKTHGVQKYYDKNLKSIKKRKWVNDNLMEV